MTYPQLAGEAFSDLSISAELHLRPPPRAAHISDTLRQIGTWVRDLPLTQDDLHHGFVVVAEGYAAAALEAPLTQAQISRAKTCRELAGLTHPTTDPTEAGLQRALTTWIHVALAAADRAEGDPRLEAIASTWEDESRMIGKAIADRITSRTREGEGRS